MCGGIRFQYNETLAPALAEVLPPAQLELARSTGIVESAFWQARPILPALVGDELRLYDWGNRDSALKLPKTGWLRIESLEAGKWNYLRPREIIIPAFQGVEKKIWFGIEHGIRGFLVQRDGAERVYMLTLPPTPEYQALTGHDRMPALIAQDSVTSLDGSSQSIFGA